MTDDPNATCKTCSNTWAWHEENKPQHQFNSGDIPASRTFGKKRSDGQGNAPSPEVVPQTASWPFDPVLRQALMDKGILTPTDLRDAEDKIRAATSTFIQQTRSET